MNLYRLKKEYPIGTILVRLNMNSKLYRVIDYNEKNISLLTKVYDEEDFGKFFYFHIDYKTLNLFVKLK